MPKTQDDIDSRNVRYWDELCGSPLATRLGIEDASLESLRRFDRAYLEMYPYLDGYLPAHGTTDRTLEIGLGYGTLSQRLAERGLDYHGLDIAEGPVQMVRDRLERLGIKDVETRVQEGSALEIPHPDAHFDRLYTIGCLHHTGNLPRAISEVHRALVPGGKAIIMLYNAHSWRLIQERRSNRGRKQSADAERLRGHYDSNAAGDAAPFTEFVSRGQARQLLSGFARVRVERRNMDPMSLGPIRISRERLLGTLDRVLGLDLYITATK